MNASFQYLFSCYCPTLFVDHFTYYYQKSLPELTSNHLCSVIKCALSVIIKFSLHML